jgi:hypothetical protein
VPKLSKYDEEMKKQKALTKKLTIDEINSWIQSMPAEKRKQVVAVVGTKSFTPEELLKEIERDTEYGKKLVQMSSRLRVEVSKKREEQ